MSTLKKILFSTFVLFLIVTFKTNATAVEDLVLCDNCLTNSDFGLMAKSVGLGNAVVVNVQTLQAKSFNVIPNLRAEGQTIAVPMVNSAEVTSAILEATALKEAFINFYAGIEIQATADSSFAGKSIGEMLLSNKSLPANGCGSPSQPWSYSKIPNMPFRSACDEHDLCYETNRSKSSCDREFYSDMREIIDNIMPITSFESIILRIVLEAQAGAYYGAVATLETALSAYCASTAGPSTECSSTSQNTAGGTKIDNTTFTSTGGNGQIITYRCELWQFPDGNGGYYYLYRNCKQTYIP